MTVDSEGADSTDVRRCELDVRTAECGVRARQGGVRTRRAWCQWGSLGGVGGGECGSAEVPARAAAPAEGDLAAPTERSVGAGPPIWLDLGFRSLGGVPLEVGAVRGSVGKHYQRHIRGKYVCR